MGMRVAQLNCQGSFAVMCEIGAWVRESGSSIVLVQEPYTTNGCIRGLPSEMRVFLDTSSNAAVIVNDVNVECLPVVANECGVCVSVEGVFVLVWRECLEKFGL